MRPRRRGVSLRALLAQEASQRCIVVGAAGVRVVAAYRCSRCWRRNLRSDASSAARRIAARVAGAGTFAAMHPRRRGGRPRRGEVSLLALLGQEPSQRCILGGAAGVRVVAAYRCARCWRRNRRSDAPLGGAAGVRVVAMYRCARCWRRNRRSDASSAARRIAARVAGAGTFAAMHPRRRER